MLSGTRDSKAQMRKEAEKELKQLKQTRWQTIDLAKEAKWQQTFKPVKIPLETDNMIKLKSLDYHHHDHKRNPHHRTTHNNNTEVKNWWWQAARDVTRSPP